MKHLSLLLLLVGLATADFFTSFGSGTSENFTQEIYGLDTGNIFVGVAFVGNQVLFTNCDTNVGRLFSPNQDAVVLGTPVHSSTQVVFPYAGCNLINHPDGYLYYTNVQRGIIRLDPNNGFREVAIAGRTGGQGIYARLGMGVDPQDPNQIFFVSGSYLYILSLSTNTYRLLPNSFAGCHDGMYFNENGTLIVTADPCYGVVRVFRRDGGQVAAVPIPGGPDGIAFHTCSNSAFVAVNDGTIWRINLTDYTAAMFASGGTRGDIGAVGPDGCFYLSFLGNTRLRNGYYPNSNAAIKICSASCKFAQSPGVAKCGDGIVQAGEDCDGGTCCGSNCKFLNATVVCRAAAGPCDVPEYCSGSNETCPTDKYAPISTPCGEFFGMCDVQLKKTCPGNSVSCYGPPAIPPLAFEAISWTDFNVISFDSFSCDSGDVEGRLAVKNTATLGGFTLGLELRLATDGWKTTSLIVGGSASWASGSLHPDGSDATFLQSGPAAFAYVGQTFTAPTYLQQRLQDPNEINHNIDPLPVFDQGKAYFVTVQSFLSNIAYNAQAELKYGDGIFITCASSASTVYHVSIDAATFSAGRWYSLHNCKFTASWIIDVAGSGPVTIQGQSFPGIVERVIYNIAGSGRTITGTTAVAGHILAPQNNYQQTTGVTYGIVVAGNITAARQNNKPNCLTFRPVTISTRVLKQITIGDTQIFVADLSPFIAGDLVCINSDCRRIISGQVGDIDGDGVVDQVVTVDQGFTSNHDTTSFLTTTANADQNRDLPLATVAASEPVPSDISSAATLIATLFVAIVALL